MTIIMILLSCSLIGTGLFLITCDILKIPFLKTSKIIKNLSKNQKVKTSSLELWLEDLAFWLSKKLKLNEYKKVQLNSDLKIAGMNITAEMHTASSIIKALISGVFILPVVFVFPISFPLVIATVIYVYFNKNKGIQKKIKIKRSAIEAELPRLVFTIEKTLTHSRDVLNILDTFRNVAGEELKSEIDITVADMRSGNYEDALERFQNRIGSDMVSDVVRGLIAVLRGDNNLTYWATLNIRFADIQRQALKAIAQKAPNKMKKLSVAMLFCFVATYFVVIVSVIIDGLGVVFQ